MRARLASLAAAAALLACTHPAPPVGVDPAPIAHAPPPPAAFPVLADPAAAPPPPKPIGTLAILGLAPDDPAGAPQAHELTLALRRAAGAPGARFVLDATASDHELAERLELGHCANEAAACMAAIGADLGVDYLIYGHVRGELVTLALMDVRAHVVRRRSTASFGDPRLVYDQLVEGVARVAKPR